MLRVVLAAIAGYVILVAATLALFAATGQASHGAASAGAVALHAVVGMAIAFGAGWVAGLLAPAAPTRAGTGLALIIALGAITSLVTSPGTPHWSQLVALVTMVPAAYFGARARARSAS